MRIFPDSLMGLFSDTPFWCHKIYTKRSHQLLFISTFKILFFIGRFFIIKFLTNIFFFFYSYLKSTFYIIPIIIFNRNIHSDIVYKMALSPGDPSSYSRPDQVHNSYILHLGVEHEYWIEESVFLGIVDGIVINVGLIPREVLMIGWVDKEDNDITSLSKTLGRKMGRW